MKKAGREAQRKIKRKIIAKERIARDSFSRYLTRSASLGPLRAKDKEKILYAKELQAGCD